MKALIGKKIGMTHIFDEKGVVVPVTVIEAGPCTVVQVKTVEKDGYSAVQLGFGLDKNVNKPMAGHVKKSGAVPKVLREFDYVVTEAAEGSPSEISQGETAESGISQGKEVSGVKVGDIFTVEVFEAGDKVATTGTSKGKGFAGTIKRHNFHRGPKTHGSHNYRAPGSIGAGYPQHVMKGMKMAGHMGAEQVTVKNLEIVAVDKTNNTIAIKGAVPGPRKGIVVVRG